MKPHFPRRPLLDELFQQSVWQNRSSGKGAGAQGRGVEESASLNLPSSIGALNSRIDRDAAGQWKTTQSFGSDDLLVLAKVADRAHSRIFELQRVDDESERAV